MARSVLLQLARDSIEEVIQAENKIDSKALLLEHPLLNEKIEVTVQIYIKGECKHSFSTNNSLDSLLKNIIIAAKKAAFSDKENCLSTAQYLHCELALTLKTPDGEMSERDSALII